MVISYKHNRMVRGGRVVPDRPAYRAVVAGHGALGVALPHPGGLWEGLRPTRATARPWVRPAFRKRAQRRRKLLRLLLALAALLAVSALTVRLATRMDSVVVLARRELPSMPEYFYQEDPAWGADPLGNSGRTLGKDGDGVACLASLMAMQQLDSPVSGDLNPGTLNAWLTENGAYDASGGLDWSRVGALLGAKAVEARPRRRLAALMEQLLLREVYPVATVRRPDTGAEHAVLVVGTVHGEFVIVDPLDPTGIPNSLSLYGNRIYGLRYLENEEA